MEETKLPFELNGYEFMSKLGSGAFSTVYKVFHKETNNYYAAKVIQNFIGSKNAEDVYDSEMIALTRLCHPHIIKLYANFQEGDNFYMILQLCETGTMKQKIASMKKGLPTDTLIYYMRQILEAIAYCKEQSMAHRDIKPSNVFIDNYGRALLGDFGFSYVQLFPSLLNSFCGSLYYRSPENLMEKPHDPFKADIWSLGVTFYFMATGKIPWPNEAPEAQRAILKCQYEPFPDSVYLPIAEMIQSMLNLDPRKRPNVHDLLALPIFQIRTKMSRRRAVMKNSLPLCQKAFVLSNSRHKLNVNASNSMIFRPEVKLQKRHFESELFIQRFRTQSNPE